MDGAVEYCHGVGGCLFTLPFYFLAWELRGKVGHDGMAWRREGRKDSRIFDSLQFCFLRPAKERGKGEVSALTYFLALRFTF